MSSPPLLRLRGVEKKFGNFTALHGIDLDIEQGEFFTIVGPSGSGKSTLIRLLVGMDELTAGEIHLRNERIDKTPASLRPTCMVFQSLALFPHMSVGQNIEFPLKIRKLAPDKRRERAMELLDLLRLPRDYFDKRISQCSGGEQQRVALARALAFDPEILFFDEPLSALDYRLRKTLEKELKDLHARTGKTFVYITHSLEEAMVMSDRIAIMNEGQFEQIAPADRIYEAPESRFVAEFMGEVNLFEVFTDTATVLSSNTIDVQPGKSHASLIGNISARTNCLLMVRPEYIQFVSDETNCDFSVTGEVLAEYALGSRIQYEIQSDIGQTLTVEKLREERLDYSPEKRVKLGFNVEQAHLIKAV